MNHFAIGCEKKQGLLSNQIDDYNYSEHMVITFMQEDCLTKPIIMYNDKQEKHLTRILLFYDITG